MGKGPEYLRGVRRGIRARGQDPEGKGWSAGSPCMPLEIRRFLEGMHFSSSLWMLSREGWQGLGAVRALEPLS